MSNSSQQSNCPPSNAPGEVQLEGQPPPDTGQKKHKKLGLKKNFSWMFVATGISGVFRWGMLLALAKVGGPESVGLWTIAQAICIPVMFLTGLNLESALVTDSRRQFAVGEYLGLRLVTNGFMVAIVAVVAFIQFGTFGYDYLCVLLFAVATIILSFRQTVLSVTTHNECLNINARSQVMISVGSLLMLVLSLWLTASVAVAIGAIIAVRLVVLFAHDWPLAHSVEKQFHPDSIKGFRVSLSRRTLRLVWVALPLGAAITALSYVNSLPIYYLERNHGTVMTGYYGGLNAFMLAFNILLGPLCQSLGPRLSKDFLHNRRSFLRILRKVTLMVVGGGVLLVPLLYIMAPWILRTALSEEYTVYWVEFVWLMVIAVFYVLCQFYSYAIQATRAFRLLLICHVALLAVTALTCHWLIPQGEPTDGLHGVIWVRGISMGVWLIGLIVCLIVRFRVAPAGEPEDSEAVKA